MGKKLQPKEFESIISELSAKEQAKLREQEISVDWLREQIGQCNYLMTRDKWVGPIWFVAYAVALFKTRFSSLTVTIFLAGMAYFIYTILKTGSFGLNRKRVQVYEQLLKAMGE
ncbi:MAG: hypothetical protein K9J37_18170 [Saprospiraceae bacterium]|nr:hypothetical protein [Saprospiraceae bacterium]MCF8251846.1 hypothetical protein [Saprospiraceae bacterium]MCF8281945.1 hypothetical protein [Bacteroidales bacterium]MCF8313320.1 hypothetical protein [Saprospiraceae bacterium]MCF8441724.1 hypothetical protein [Saprospiraceae bacterium]